MAASASKVKRALHAILDAGMPRARGKLLHKQVVAKSKDKSRAPSPDRRAKLVEVVRKVSA